MKKRLLLLSMLCVTAALPTVAQTDPNNPTNQNGQLDMLEEFSKMHTEAIPMPDGTQLMTDIYVPITNDSMRIDIDLPEFTLPIIGTVDLGTQNLEVIRKGTQLMIYDSVDYQPNPNPYQLPMLFTRSPYNKKGDVVGRVVSIMGYSYALQDMRGRYASQGVYMPMFSDSWNKNAYHNYFRHVLDITPLSDPRNGNRHEDGYNSVQYLANSLKKWYDLDGDGINETYDFINNGSIGMFGASALGNTQLQAAAAHRVNPNDRGLKCLFPIVATIEHYRYTGYQNGVFRDRIVTGWLRGQIADTDDTQNAVDNSIDNSIHSSTDYNAPNKFVAANRAIDHFCENRYGTSPAGYYPNAVGRADMDASFAPVDVNGESVANDGFTPLSNLNYSRYKNMDVPTFHLTGWWDIFTDGQLETWRLTRQHLVSNVGNEKKQKIVIGPWAHQTIGGRKTGGRVYKKNVGDIIGFAIDDIDINSLDINKVLQSEIISWFRENLNRNDNYKYLGEPKAFIPRSETWQPITAAGLNGAASVRVPAEDFKIPFVDLLNFLSGNGGLTGLQVEIKVAVPLLGDQFIPLSVDIPALGNPILPNLGGTVGTVTQSPGSIDFDKVPNVRFYVAGPDSAADVAANFPQNGKVGNYWFAADSFPLTKDITWNTMYLHTDGSVNTQAPTQSENPKVYVDDPNDPVMTVGGANMIVMTPDADSVSQGQMEMTGAYANYCMNRPGVIQFQTDVVADSMSVIGYPKFVLYAKSNPDGLTSGETNTDFFVRIADVFPDGREYFVFEGCVGSRAKAYAEHIYNTTKEDPNIPFANININQIYEYKFEMMPIAYTFGKGHRMKILISSSNYPRYQATPHLPLHDGEYFRRKPGDGQGYTYNGQFMLPRTAIQRVYFSPQQQTHIELPIYKSTGTVGVTPPIKVENSLQVVAYPNPVNDKLFVSVNQKGDYQLILLNTIGQEVMRQALTEDAMLDVSKLPAGVYQVQITDKTGKVGVTKVSVY
ncbi:MAG: CocE/NonD family hydrolase [Bacteroidia bacterium]